MSRYFVPAIILAAAPLSLAGAEPTPTPTSIPDSTPPANCLQMQQMHQGNMQQHTGNGTMGGSGQMMQNGAGGMGAGHMGNGSMGNGTMSGSSMGNGAMGSGNMQGQMMQNGGGTGMGPGNHQAMMRGQGQCPAASQPESGQSTSGN